MPPSDDQLVSAALQGRQEAFAELVRRYQRPVFSLIVRMVGRPAVAAELAQDTFLKAFRRLDSFDRRRSLSAWLLRIAHNTTVDALRRKDHRSDEMSEGAVAVRSLVSSAPGPDRQAEDRLLLDDLATAMERLRPEHRLALVLRVQDDRSYREIAYVMGVTEGTAKSYVHRARRTLAEDMRRAGWGAATGGSETRNTN